MDTDDIKLAWVIGINDYDFARSSIPPLENAVRDATEVGRVLAARSFSVTQIPEHEATKERIERLVSDEIPRIVAARPRARILVYFGGHGFTRLDERGFRHGYLVPFGATRDSIDGFIDMALVREALDRIVVPSETSAGAISETKAPPIPCHRHVLLVLDCCHAGAFVHAPRLRDFASTDRLSKPLYHLLLDRAACQLLASTTHDQPAHDGYLERCNGEASQSGHSPFAEAFIAALGGNRDQPTADANLDGVVTATEIYARVADALQRRSRETAGATTQTPGLWPLASHAGGEFLVELSSPNFAEAGELKPEHNPYPGLAPFQASQSATFFGRESVVREVEGRLQRKALAVLSGDSGVGKTSLVNAGLAPRLEGAGVQVRWITPPTNIAAKEQGAALLQALASALAPSAVPGGLRKVVLVLDPASPILRLGEGSDSERKALAVLRLLWAPPAERAASISKALAEAACTSAEEARTIRSALERAELDLRTVLVVRSADEPLLRALLPEQETAQWESIRLELPPLNREELRECIEKPAALCHLWFDDARVDGRRILDRILDEAEDGSLSLLAERLRALFLAYVTRSRRTGIDDWLLRWEDYLSVDSTAKVTLRIADDLYRDLGAAGDAPTASQKTLLRVLMRMSPIEGIDDGDVRIVNAEELDAVDTEEQTRIAAVLAEAVDRRLITQSQAPNDSPVDGTKSVQQIVTGAYAPVHAALIRDWQPLKEWRSSVNEPLALRRLAGAARDWSGATEGLWDDDRSLVFFRLPDRMQSRRTGWWLTQRFAVDKLFQGLDPYLFNRYEHAFLTRSLQRRRFVFFGVTGILLIVILALSAATGITLAQRNKAERQSRIARAQELAAKSIRLRDGDRQLAALLAIEASKVTDTTEVQNALLSAASGAEALPRSILRTGNRISTMAHAVGADVFATAHPDGTIQIWSGPDRRPLGVPLVRTGKTVTLLSIDALGKRLAAVYQRDRWDHGKSSEVILWDLSTGTIDGAPLVQPRGIGAIALSPRGDYLATSGDTFDQTIRLWDLSRRSLIGQPVEIRDRAQLVFSPDGRVLAAATDDGKVFFFTVPDLMPALTTRKYASRLTAIAADPRGDRFAVGQLDGAIRFIDLRKHDTKRSAGTELDEPDPDVIDSAESTSASLGARELPIPGHKGSVNSLAYRSDGVILASGGNDGTIRLWHADAQKPLVPPNDAHWVTGTSIDHESGALVDDYALITPEPHGRPVVTARPECRAYVGCDSVLVGFSQDGRTLFASFGADVVPLWDTPIGKPVQGWHVWSLQRQFAELADVAVRLRGSSVDISRRDPAQGGVKTVRLDNSPRQLLLDREGKTLVAFGDVTIAVVDVRTAAVRPFSILSGHAHAISADGSTLAVATRSNELRLYALDSGALIGRPLAGVWKSMESLAFSPDGKQIAVGYENGSLAVLDGRSQTKICEVIGGDKPIELIAFSADGRWVATSSKLPDTEKRRGIGDRADHAPEIRLWDAAHCVRTTAPLRGHTERILQLRFSPDGRLLASGADDHSIRLWDVSTGQQVGRELDAKQSVEALAFDDMGRVIVAGTSDLDYQKFLLGGPELVSLVCRLASRNLSYDEWALYFPGTDYSPTCKGLPLDPSILDGAVTAAKAGDVARARALYMLADRLQPDLKIEPQRAVDSLVAVAQGERLAREGDLVAAKAAFERAHGLDPKLVQDPAETAKLIAAEAMLQRGEQLARQERIAEATESIERARQIAKSIRSDAKPQTLTELESQLKFGTSKERAQVIARAWLTSQARELAEAGNVTLAAELFVAASRYTPDGPALTMQDAAAQAQRIAVEKLTQRAKEAVARNHEDEAERVMGTVKTLVGDPSLEPKLEVGKMVASTT